MAAMTSTYDADNELFAALIDAHKEWVVHDEVAGQEVRVVSDGARQYSLGMLAQVQRLVDHHWEDRNTEKDEECNYNCYYEYEHHPFYPLGCISADQIHNMVRSYNFKMRL